MHDKHTSQNEYLDLFITNLGIVGDGASGDRNTCCTSLHLHYGRPSNREARLHQLGHHQDSALVMPGSDSCGVRDAREDTCGHRSRSSDSSEKFLFDDFEQQNRVVEL